MNLTTINCGKLDFLMNSIYNSADHPEIQRILLDPVQPLLNTLVSNFSGSIINALERQSNE